MYNVNEVDKDIVEGGQTLLSNNEVQPCRTQAKKDIMMMSDISFRPHQHRI